MLAGRCMLTAGCWLLTATSDSPRELVAVLSMGCCIFSIASCAHPLAKLGRAVLQVHQVQQSLSFRISSDVSSLDACSDLLRLVDHNAGMSDMLQT